MFEIEFTNKMKHDVKLMQRRGKNIAKLITALNLLASRTPMPERYRDHQFYALGELKSLIDIPPQNR